MTAPWGELMKYPHCGHCAWDNKFHPSDKDHHVVPCRADGCPGGTPMEGLW